MRLGDMSSVKNESRKDGGSTSPVLLVERTTIIIMLDALV